MHDISTPPTGGSLNNSLTMLLNKCYGLPLGVSLFPRGQMIFLMQYSERIPYGPTSLRFIISVVVMSVSDVSLVKIKQINATAPQPAVKILQACEAALKMTLIH